jgi:DNA-binding beta-propeller fold protein YncE
LDRPLRPRSRWVDALLLIAGLTIAACGGPTAAGAAHGAMPETTGGHAQRRATVPEQPDASSRQHQPPVEVVWQSDGGAHRLGGPMGLTVDRQGDLIVVDAAHDRLVQLAGGAGQGLTSWGAAGRLGFRRPDRCPDWSAVSSGDMGACKPAGGGSVAVGDQDEIIVSDIINHRVQVFDRDGQFRMAWGGPGPAEGQFIEPSGLAVDARGHLYIADRWNHRIQKFDRQGALLLAWGHLGSGDGEFKRPAAVALDRRGQVYVLDGGNYRVQVFDVAGRFLAAWGGFGREPGELVHPIGLAIDRDGRAYLADGGDQRIKAFSDNGIFLGQWGGSGVGPGQFADMSGIAVDDEGAIYVADSALGRVQKFRPRAPWPQMAGTPTPRPARPTPTPPAAAPFPIMTPTDR